MRISPIQVYFPAEAVERSANLKYQQFAPLPPVYPNIVFEFVSHADTHPDIRSWVKSYYDGAPYVQNITIGLWNADPNTAVASAVASYDLVDCAPVAYEEISLNLLGGHGGIRRYTLEVKCHGILIDLPDNTLDEWIKDMQSGANYLRDIFMRIFDSNGDLTDSYNFSESFLTGYSLPPLDKNDDDVEVVETIEIVPGYSDDLLQ